MKYFKLKKNRKNLDLTCPKKLIEQLTKPNITVAEANEIINELNNKIINESDNKKIEDIHKNIYNFLASLDKLCLLTIKINMTKIEKINNSFDRDITNVFLMILSTVCLSFVVNIYSNLAVNDTKITVPFFEYTTKSINNSIFISLAFISIILISLITYLFMPRPKKKLYSIDLVLINMIEHIIDVNNNKNIITTSVVEVTKMTENKARKETVKFRKENKKAPVNNTSAEK